MSHQSETTGPYEVIKKFTVCLSLLCPYYTFYYDYKFIVDVKNGKLQLATVCFLNDEKFTHIKGDLSLELITSKIKDQYPTYDYISHFVLMNDKINKGTPYSMLSVDDTEKFSFFEYLFYPQLPTQIYP